MAITVKCDSCGKAFKADERFIGKRMRCKSCGQVFTVAAEGDGSQLSEDESLLSGIAEAASESTRGGMPAQSGYVPPVQIMSDDEPIENRGIRRTQAFNFPFADVLDSWGPKLIVLGGLAWLVFESLNSKYEGPVWVPLARLGLLLALFTFVIVPIVARGIELAARKFRFTFPPEPGWRTFATFFFPFVLGYVLWHVSGDVGSIILGLVSGLIVSLGLFWFLFRQQPRELPLSFAYSAGSFMVGSLVVGAIVFGLNLLAMNVLTGMRQAHHFASSPFGPSLAWDSTAPPPEEGDRKDNKRVAVADKPAAKPRPKPKPVQKPAEAPDVQPAKPPVANRNQVPAAAPDPRDAEAPLNDPFSDPPKPAGDRMAQDDSPSESIFSDTADGTGSTLPRVSGGQRSAKRGSSTPVTEDDADIPVVGGESDAPVIGRSDGLAEGIIADVREVDEIGAFDDIIFPSTPSRYLATIQRGPNADTVELWSSNPYDRMGIVKFEHGPGVRDRYILSPDGNYLLRITDDLRLAVQVFSFKTKKTSPSIDLNEMNGRATLVGFLNDDIFALAWQGTQGKGGLQTFSVSEGKQRKAIVLPNFRPTDGNFAVRKDGLQIAYVGRESRGMVVELLELGAGGKGRTIPISTLGAGAMVMPEGIGFSPTNNKIAVVFERGNQRLVLGWQLSTGANLVIDQIYNSNQAASENSNNAIAWLPDGSALLVKGQVILSGMDGSPIADVNQLKNAFSQRVLDGETVEIVVSAGKQKKLGLVTLDPAAMAEAAGTSGKGAAGSR